MEAFHWLHLEVKVVVIWRYINKVQFNWSGPLNINVACMWPTMQNESDISATESQSLKQSTAQKTIRINIIFEFNLANS